MRRGYQAHALVERLTDVPFIWNFCKLILDESLRNSAFQPCVAKPVAFQTITIFLSLPFTSSGRQLIEENRALNDRRSMLEAGTYFGFQCTASSGPRRLALESKGDSCVSL